MNIESQHVRDRLGFALPTFAEASRLDGLDARHEAELVTALEEIASAVRSRICRRFFRSADKIT